MSNNPYTVRPAGTHKTAEEAFIEASAAMDDLPLHFGVDEVHIWRYADGDHIDKDKRAKWTWSISIVGVLGGYERPFDTDAERVGTRRLILLAALRSADDLGGRP